MRGKGPSKTRRTGAEVRPLAVLGLRSARHRGTHLPWAAACLHACAPAVPPGASPVPAQNIFRNDAQVRPPRAHACAPCSLFARDVFLRDVRA
jgi:hypothetical protein